jgi:hypothetical protein
MENQTKPQPTHRTRSGLKAGIYSTDNGGEYPVHGWYEDEKGDRIATSWTNNLRYRREVKLGGLDIFPLPKKIKVQGWLNVYSESYCEIYDEKHIADNLGKKRIACIPIDIEVEEGQGIENYNFNK